MQRHGPLAIRDGQLVGAHGRPVELRGVSTQWLNWERDYASSREALAFLRDDWGLEVLRVANGVAYATGYLANPESRAALVRQIVENAIAEDVYVIVDWHAHQAHPEAAAAFFGDIAMRYGHHPHVLYETFNEPLGSSWASVREAQEPALSAIRLHDPDNVVILGTPEWSTRPDLAIADPLEGKNLAYTLHFYACTHGDRIRGYGQTALDAGLAVFVTEWAATPFEGGTALRYLCPQATATWQHWLDEQDISSVAWKLSTDFDLAGMLAPGAPVTGGWTDEHLAGHGPWIRAWLRRPERGARRPR